MENNDWQLVSFILPNGDVIMGMIDVPYHQVPAMTQVSVFNPIRMILSTDDEGLARLNAFPFDMSSSSSLFVINTLALLSPLPSIELDEEIVEIYHSSLEIIYPNDEIKFQGGEKIENNNNKEQEDDSTIPKNKILH